MIKMLKITVAGRVLKVTDDLVVIDANGNKLELIKCNFCKVPEVGDEIWMEIEGYDRKRP